MGDTWGSVQLSKGELMGTTRVTVTARYEVEYDGQVTEDDIDINDVLRDPNALTDIKVTTKKGGHSLVSKALGIRS